MVTPSFNQAQFVEAAIRSVLLQGYPDLEYFIVDGGSTDGSLSIIRRYERWLSAWLSQPDHGQSEAVNRGWQRATGEIIGWLNTDDLLWPGALQRVVQEFEADPDAIAIVGGGLLIDARGRVIAAKRPRPLDLKSALLSGNFYQPCVFLRRRAVGEVGLLDTRLQLIMDWHFWIRLLLRFEPHTIRYTEDPLAAQRLWPGTKTNRARMAASSEERRLVLNELFEGAALPPHLLSLHTQAIATTYWRQGHFQREARHPVAALRSVHRAHQLAPELYSWRVGWIIQFWLHTYVRYPFWLLPYWAARRLWREVRLRVARARTALTKGRESTD